MKNNIFIVMEQDCNNGLKSIAPYAFTTEDKAKEFIEERKKFYSELWSKQNYETVYEDDGVSVRGFECNIYACFWIEETELRGA